MIAYIFIVVFIGSVIGATVSLLYTFYQMNRARQFSPIKILWPDRIPLGSDAGAWRRARVGLIAFLACWATGVMVYLIAQALAHI